MGVGLLSLKWVQPDLQFVCYFYITFADVLIKPYLFICCIVVILVFVFFDLDILGPWGGGGGRVRELPIYVA